MLKLARLALASLALLPALTAAPAIACSVGGTYRVPTNLELTADAEVILLAKIVSGSTDPSGESMMLTVQPIEVLKGQVPLDKPLNVPGMIAEPRFAVLSDPMQLEQAHPLAYIGGCIRYMFVRDATVLFYLSPIEKVTRGADFPAELRGTLMPAGGPFSRWAEDVPSADAPWVRATRLYVKAAALPADEQRALLTAERDKLRALTDQESKILADDIDRQLVTPDKPWNQLMEEAVKKAREEEANLPGGAPES